MGRGLIAGANLLVFTSLVGSLFVSFSPMWLVERTEMKLSFCWIGDGIWRTNFIWGSDLMELPPKQRQCSGESLSTYEAYCGDNQIDDEYEGYNAGMCRSTNTAKVLSILASVFAFLPMVFILLKILTVKSGLINRSRKGWTYVVLAAVFSFASAVMTIATIIVMFSSPLFSAEHRRYLSKTLHGMPYKGYECVFQTPVYSVFTLMNSAPLKCLMPGPALSAGMMELIAISLATVFYALEAKDMWQKRHVSFRQSRVMLLSSMVNSAAGLIPDVHVLPRNFSLFGGASRAFDKWGKVAMHLLVSGLPYLVMILNAVCWALFIYTGVQVLMVTEVSISYPAKHNPVSEYKNLLQWDDKKAADYWAETCQTDPLLPNFPEGVDRYEAHAALKNLVQHLIGNNGETLITLGDIGGSMLSSSDDDSEMVGDKKPEMNKWTLLTIYMNLFNYSPITSLKFFWDGGAGLVAIAQFLAVLVWPILKVILWIYLWFVPMNDVSRGRMLSWIDALGKWTLANIYVLVLMGASNTFTRHIDIPWLVLPLIIPRGGSLNVLVRVSLCEGLGSVSFVLSNVFSLLIGQMQLLSHRYVKAWEEQRIADDQKAVSEEEEEEGEEQQSEEDERDGGGKLDEENDSLDTGEYMGLGIGYTPPPPAIPIRVMPAVATASVQTDASSSSRGGESSSPKTRTMKIDTSNALHPDVEAMHDRIHSPYFGHHYRWSPLGKVIIWLFIFLIIGVQLIVQSVPLIHVEMKGITGQLVVAPNDKNRDLSLLSITEKLWVAGYPVPNYSISITYFIFTVMFPVAHSVFLALMWTIPLTINQQGMLFNALEITGAWDALDVFVVALAAVLIEAEAVVGNLINLTVPNLAELVRMFGFKAGMESAELSLLPGFWALVFSLVMQRLLNYFILEQAACALSERRAEIKLIEWSQDKSAFSFSPLALRGIAKLRGSTLAAAIGARKGGPLSPIFGTAGGSPSTGAKKQTGGLATIAENDEAGGQLQAIPNIGDYVERVLETTATGLFSPGNRYVSSMWPQYLYAGLPRRWWQIMHHYGLLEECVLGNHRSQQQQQRSGASATDEESEAILNAPFALDAQQQQQAKYDDEQDASTDFQIGE